MPIFFFAVNRPVFAAESVRKLEQVTIIILDGYAGTFLFLFFAHYREIII